MAAFCQTMSFRAGETSQWARALAAYAENSVTIPSTYMAAPNHLLSK